MSLLEGKLLSGIQESVCICVFVYMCVCVSVCLMKMGIKYFVFEIGSKYLMGIKFCTNSSITNLLTWWDISLSPFLPPGLP